MISFNETINQEFFVEQLEARLETDPLMVGGLFDLFTAEQVEAAGWCIGHSCGEHSCFINW